MPKFVLMGSPLWSILVCKIPEFLEVKAVRSEFCSIRYRKHTHSKESKEPGFPFSIDLRTKFVWSHGLLIYFSISFFLNILNLTNLFSLVSISICKRVFDFGIFIVTSATRVLESYLVCVCVCVCFFFFFFFFLMPQNAFFNHS